MVFCLTQAGALGRAASVEALLEHKLLEQIRRVDSRLGGALGVAILDLQSGRILVHNGDTVFPQASSIKVPIMVEAFASAQEGRLKLTEKVTLQPSEAVGGSGHLRMLLRSGPVTITMDELITAMIETSDNTATNRAIAILGMDRVNARMDALGLTKTRLRRVMLDFAAAARGDDNVSTPIEMARLMEMIYRGRAVSPEASKRMLEKLKLVEADFRRTVPADVEVASKPGELTGVRCETGVLFIPGRPVVLSVASAFLNDGENPVPEVVRLVYQHYAKMTASPANPVLPGTSPRLVK